MIPYISFLCVSGWFQQVVWALPIVVCFVMHYLFVGMRVGFFKFYIYCL